MNKTNHPWEKIAEKYPNFFNAWMVYETGFSIKTIVTIFKQNETQYDIHFMPNENNGDWVEVHEFSKARVRNMEDFLDSIGFHIGITPTLVQEEDSPNEENNVVEFTAELFQTGPKVFECYFINIEDKFVPILSSPLSFKLFPTREKAFFSLLPHIVTKVEETLTKKGDLLPYEPSKRFEILKKRHIKRLETILP